jgi:hypothetical protein
MAPSFFDSAIPSYFDSFLLALFTEARRSAHRRFMASAIRLRPSGVRFLFRFALFTLPLGRPRFGAAAGPLVVVPVNALRACCNRAICASISESIRLTSIPLSSIFLS